MKSRIGFLVVVLVLAASAAWATNVTFQVNMSVQQALGNFTPGTNNVVVRGSFNGWSGNTNQLSDAGSGIYTGTWDIAQGAIEFKYVIIGGASDVWESVDNRTATVGADPLTLPVVYFNNQTSSDVADVEVRFRVNMEIQELTGNFDPAVDWVVVRGNHANIGSWGGATQLTEETTTPGVYSAWITFDALPQGGAIEYKYVILVAGDVNNARWESSNNRSFTPTGQEPDNLPPPSGNGYGEIIPDLVYFSNVGPGDIITNDLNVIFQVDVYPLLGRLRDLGFIYDVQTGDTVYSIESIQAAGFFNNWPWGNFAPEHYMNDDGVNGDVTAGDNVWSRSILFAAGSPRVLIYKYGVNQLDVEAGFARNHDVTLDDSQQNFYIPILCWGNQDTLYDSWQDECLHSAVDDHSSVAPSSYRLDQNYPNPFNPSTRISFALPRADAVTLRVFDLLGREVTTMNLGRMEAGDHTVGFDGSTLASGVYFYRLETPNFNATRKMLLMK